MLDWIKIWGILEQSHDLKLIIVILHYPAERGSFRGCQGVSNLTTLRLWSPILNKCTVYYDTLLSEQALKLFCNLSYSCLSVGSDSTKACLRPPCASVSLGYPWRWRWPHPVTYPSQCGPCQTHSNLYACTIFAASNTSTLRTKCSLLSLELTFASPMFCASL